MRIRICPLVVTALFALPISVGAHGQGGGAGGPPAGVGGGATAGAHGGPSSGAGSGAANANQNAAFGQATAASAQTLKDAEVATRQDFGNTVKQGAHQQGKEKPSEFDSFEDEMDDSFGDDHFEPRNDSGGG